MLLRYLKKPPDLLVCILLVERADHKRRQVKAGKLCTFLEMLLQLILPDLCCNRIVKGLFDPLVDMPRWSGKIREAP